MKNITKVVVFALVMIVFHVNTYQKNRAIVLDEVPEGTHGRDTGSVHRK